MKNRVITATWWRRKAQHCGLSCRASGGFRSGGGGREGVGEMGNVQVLIGDEKCK